MDFFDPAMFVRDEPFGGGEKETGVGAELCGGLFLAVVEPINLGPLGPGIVGRALKGRGRKDFELDQAPATLAERGADAVSAGVTAADDDDVLVLGGDEIAIPFLFQEAARIAGQEVHGQVDAFEVAALDGEVARTGGARA